MHDNQIDRNSLILKNALKRLNLRFPVAEISKKTGYSKGNVSSFINGKVSVSENFIDTFLESFKLNKIELLTQTKTFFNISKTSPDYRKLTDEETEFITWAFENNFTDLMQSKKFKKEFLFRASDWVTDLLKK